MSELRTPTRTATYERRLAKRYSAEKRFRALGLTAILFSVAVLLCSCCSPWPAAASAAFSASRSRCLSISPPCRSTPIRPSWPPATPKPLCRRKACPKSSRSRRNRSMAMTAPARSGRTPGAPPPRPSRAIRTGRRAGRPSGCLLRPTWLPPTTAKAIPRCGRSPGDWPIRARWPNDSIRASSPAPTPPIRKRSACGER